MDFNSEPYWDDFEASNGAKDKNYMRILFRPGYSVQARELTQIQSIIQNQLKNFGDHIFKDGSPVYGGHISLDTSLTYLTLQSAYNGVDIDVADFENRVIFNSSGTAKIRAKVVASDETRTYPTLMVRYLRGTTFPDGNVITTSSGSFAQLTTANSSGIGSVASIAEGVFYVDGYFVKVEPQTIVLDPYGSTPTYKIGLEIDDEIMDESGDANLLDPAQASFNYQAPGAHRYRFALNLAKRKLDSIDDQKFFELLRVESGLITKQVVYPIYSEIEKTLARRTFDESGDYTVRPFAISLASNTACNDVFIVNIEPGKAYVKGFEYETQGTQSLRVNKARTKNTSTDYDLSLEYGNYLYANNILGSANGLFDISKLDQLELHCVPRSNINVTNSITYNSTYMGTARIRNIVRASATEYIVYITDTQLASNTVTAGSTATNSSAIVFPVNYANVENAYANVSVRVLTGNSAGDVRKITSYNIATRTAFVDLPFTGIVGSGNTVSLLYNTKDIDALVEVVSNKTALNVAMDVSNSSKGNYGDTVIYDSNKNSLLFMLPEQFIANGSITNADFVHTKFFESKTFTSNGQFALTLSGNETYDYGSDGSFLSGTTANSNIIVMVKSLGTASNVTVGQIINLTGTLAGVKRDSTTQLTIFTGANGTFTGDVYARVKVNNSESSSNNRRTKTVRGNNLVTVLRAADNISYGTAVTGAANTKIDAGNGFVWFTSNYDINKTPGSNNSLYVPDVFKVIKIYESGSDSFAPNSTNAIDVTNNFYLDSGQNLNYYDHSKLVLKPGATAPKGQTVAMIQYYEHSSAINGYFDVDSYPDTQYANGTIPVFVSSTGDRYNLRDAVDFRPTRETGNTSYNIIGMKTPLPSEAMELTYQYYVPRIDKVVVTKDRELKTITGVASKYPVEPTDSENAMTLYKLEIPAYTANPSDITVTALDHKRYTMKDIGNLETRIKNVEYYTALNRTEKRATDTTILYEDNATQKEKYGILVDNFKAFNVADTKSPDFICAVDKGALFPYTNMKSVDLTLNQVGTSLQKNDKTVSLKYTEAVAIEQLSATANVSVQPYLYGKFDGNMRLTPASDSWFSVTIPPVVVTATQVLPAILSPPQSDSVPTAALPPEPISSTSTTVDLNSSIDTASTTTFVNSGTFGTTPVTVVDSWFPTDTTDQDWKLWLGQFYGTF
jgi:hypothetical protein